MPSEIESAIERVKALHPDAIRIKVSTVTRKAVYLKYESPRLGTMGLFVQWRKPSRN